MSHDELVEELAREHRYRGVLVVSAVVGIVASAILGLVFALGGFEPGRGSHNATNLSFFVVPFAASMVIGGGIHRALLAHGRRQSRTKRR